MPDNPSKRTIAQEAHEPKNHSTSLAKLAGIKADVLLEGHFGVIEGQAAIQKFIRSFMA